MKTRATLLNSSAISPLPSEYLCDAREFAAFVQAAMIGNEMVESAKRPGTPYVYHAWQGLDRAQAGYRTFSTGDRYFIDGEEIDPSRVRRHDDGSYVVEGRASPTVYGVDYSTRPDMTAEAVYENGRLVYVNATPSA